MKIDVNKTIEVIMILNENEAKWLKSIMQNPICDGESEKDRRMRKLFWDMLDQENIHLL